MSTLILYYSGTGNNNYLARKLSQKLSCDIEEIRPALNVPPLQILFSFLRMGPGIGRFSHDLNNYDSVIVCGPVWAGQLVAPLAAAIKKARKRVRKVHFVTCCGSRDEKKHDTFGYARVFKRVQDLAGDTCGQCEAFPVAMVLPENKQDNGDAIMNTRLSDSNFTGAIAERLEAFVGKVR